MESDLSSFNFSIFDIYFIANEYNGYIFTYSGEIFMPFGYISIGDSGTDIKHDDSTMTTYVVAFS